MRERGQMRAGRRKESAEHQEPKIRHQWERRNKDRDTKRGGK